MITIDRLQPGDLLMAIFGDQPHARLIITKKSFYNTRNWLVEYYNFHKRLVECEVWTVEYFDSVWARNHHFRLIRADD